MKMCTAEWKSRGPCGRACRGAARAKTQRTGLWQITNRKAWVAVAAVAAVAEAGLACRRARNSPAVRVPRGPRRGGRASAMATNWLAGAPFGVQSHRWGGAVGERAHRREAGAWGRGSERGVMCEGWGGLAVRGGGGTFYPPPACRTSLPRVFYHRY